MDESDKANEVVTVVKVEFDHYRVMPIRTLPNRCTPPDDALRRYSPRYGWALPRVKVLKPHPRGGKTVCRVTLSDGRSAKGIAVCSMADQFCYRLGRNIARGRAMHALGLH